ncbi:hypothetical protein PVAG01_10602 [Phlyctema vagabunda]|uniref:Transcription factor domain-containing protein n=1 Tax=Phlyctema vagabunda TaxID=108571 RepID=A0ABR4P342_9HELO
MSDLSEERTDGRLYAELVEDLVFSHPLLSLYLDPEFGEKPDLPPVKIMQAAYLVCLLQNWEGDDIAKKRIRQHRFTTLLSIARDIGFSSMNHNIRSLDPVSWESFVEREQAIRTFTYIFLLDSAFLIFNNTPPKIMLQELEVELTCSEDIFQAETSEACQALWQLSSINVATQDNFTLASAIEAFTRSAINPITNLPSRLSTLNLFAIISGFHTILFQHRTLFAYPLTSLEQIRLAIERWKVVWEQRAENNPTILYHTSKSWQRVGFIGHADEYAALALAQLDNLETQRASGAPKLGNPGVQASLERLDDTSMSQITNLMLNLAVATD